MNRKLTSDSRNYYNTHSGGDLIFSFQVNAKETYRLDRLQLGLACAPPSFRSRSAAIGSPGEPPNRKGPRQEKLFHSRCVILYIGND